MDENLLAGISHDKPVSLGSVEPFDAAAFGIGWGWLGVWLVGLLAPCLSCSDFFFFAPDVGPAGVRARFNAALDEVA